MKESKSPKRRARKPSDKAVSLVQTLDDQARKKLAILAIERGFGSAEKLADALMVAAVNRVIGERECKLTITIGEAQILALESLRSKHWPCDDGKNPMPLHGVAEWVLSVALARPDVFASEVCALNRYEASEGVPMIENLDRKTIQHPSYQQPNP